MKNSHENFSKNEKNSQDSICPFCGSDLRTHNTAQLIACAIDELGKINFQGRKF